MITHNLAAQEQPFYRTPEIRYTDQDLYHLIGHDDLTIACDPIDSYIYFYHLDTLMVLPELPENIADNSRIQFATSTPMSRSAPIYSFKDAGPRTIQFKFTLHRDLMKQSNQDVSIGTNDDYIETFIKYLNSSCVPKYAASSKMIDPPIVAIKICETLFIKGVVDGSVAVTWSGPILRDDKYAVAEVMFSVSEIVPYSAEEIVQVGSFRDPGDSRIPNVTQSLYSQYKSTNKSYVNG